MKSFSENIYKYILGIVIAICGWLISASYNRAATSIETLNKDVIMLKIQLTEIQTKMLDEEKVKDIVETELLKHGIK